MQFVWDEAKRKSNLAKHGLDFADAHRIFAGIVIEQPDTRFDYEEQRMIAVEMLDPLSCSSYMWNAVTAFALFQ